MSTEARKSLVQEVMKDRESLMNLSDQFIGVNQSINENEQYILSQSIDNNLDVKDRKKIKRKKWWETFKSTIGIILIITPLCFIDTAILYNLLIGVAYDLSHVVGSLLSMVFAFSSVLIADASVSFFKYHTKKTYASKRDRFLAVSFNLLIWLGFPLMGWLKLDSVTSKIGMSALSLIFHYVQNILFDLLWVKLFGSSVLYAQKESDHGKETADGLLKDVRKKAIAYQDKVKRLSGLGESEVATSLGNNASQVVELALGGDTIDGSSNSTPSLEDQISSLESEIASKEGVFYEDYAQQESHDLQLSKLKAQLSNLKK